MSNTFKLHGDISAGPSCSGGSPSGWPNVVMALDESLALDGAPMVVEYELTSDAVQAVSFGGLADASVVVIKSIGGKVRARLTSADGATQAIAVDTFALLISESVPYTALDLMRVAGTETQVKVLLGKKA